MSSALMSVRFDEAVRLARLRKASDIHLAAGRPPVLRIDGLLEVHGAAQMTTDDIASILDMVLDKIARAQLDARGDVTISRPAEGGMLRVHAYRHSHGIAIAIRLLSESIPSLESLHLPGSVQGLADRENGLVLFSGPTGSGKSTAMAACVGRINTKCSKHVLTIEDPIEYRHESKLAIISQREIGRDVETFDRGICGALRSDPDVILVGELRDPATMHAALTAAETGHLVLTTLHTGDAPQTIDRIVGAFSGDAQEEIRTQLAQTLAGVVCLRLVPRASSAGRCCAAEVLIANDAVRNVIRDGKTHQLRNVISTSRAAGMQTLESHLSELVGRGEIALSAARAATDRASDVCPDARNASAVS